MKSHNDFTYINERIARIRRMEKYIIPLLIKRNEELYENHYYSVTDDIDKEFRFEITSLMKNIKGLKNKENRDNFIKALYSDDFIKYPLLCQIDYELVETLHSLDAGHLIPPLSSFMTDVETIIKNDSKISQKDSESLFKFYIKEEALTRIEEGKKRVLQIEEKYRDVEKYFKDKEKNVELFKEKDLTLMNLLNEGLKREIRLQDQQKQLKNLIEGLESKLTSFENTKFDQTTDREKQLIYKYEKKRLSDAHTALQRNREALKILHDEIPEVTYINLNKAKKEYNNYILLDILKEGLRKAKDSLNKLPKMIISEDVPLYELTPVIETVLKKYHITAGNNDYFSKHVFQILKNYKHKKIMITVGQITMAVGVLVACFFVPAGVGALIAFASGMLDLGKAVHDFEEAHDLLIVTNANAKLVDISRQQAKTAFIWGVIDLALSAVDFFLAGAEFVDLLKGGKALKPTKYKFKNKKTVNYAHVISELDDETLGLLYRLSDATRNKFYCTVINAPDYININLIIKNINKLNNFDDGLILANKIYKTADGQVIKGIDILNNLNDNTIIILNQFDELHNVDLKWIVEVINNPNNRQNIINASNEFQNQFKKGTIYTNNINDFINKTIRLNSKKVIILKQTSNNIDELYKQAKIANKELIELTNSIAKKTNGKAKFPPGGGLKDKKRALEKIIADYNNDPSQILDIARSSLEFESLENIYNALNEINNNYYILQIKDRFKNPQPSGYRDILINLKMSNDHIVEVQLHLKSILEAKTKETKYYNIIRQIEDIAKKEGRELSKNELLKIMELHKKSKKIYKDALK